MKNLYLALAVLGWIIPYIFVGIFISNNWVNFSLFFQEVFANPAASMFAIDLIFSIVVFLLFVFIKAKEYNIKKPWIFILICMCIWLSCALPLFLYFKEKNKV